MLKRLVLGTKNIEIAEQNQVARPGRRIQSALFQEFRDSMYLAHAPFRVRLASTPQNVNGRQHKCGPPGLEADNKGCAPNLRHRLWLAVFILYRRQHEFSGKAAKRNLAGIVDECHALTVALRPDGRIGHDVFPVFTQNFHDPLQSLQVLEHFLNGDQIEMRKDLGDVVNRFLQTVAVGGFVEVTDVPGCEQQRFTEGSVRNLLAQCVPERQQTLDGAFPFF